MINRKNVTLRTNYNFMSVCYVDNNLLYVPYLDHNLISVCIVIENIISFSNVDPYFIYARYV